LFDTLRGLSEYEFVGLGYENIVFSDGDRVRKVSLPCPVTIGGVVFENLGNGTIRDIGSQLEKFSDSEKVFQKALDRGVSEGFFGNPSFDSNGNYWQDKVMVFQDRLEEKPHSKRKEMIDDYLDFFETCIEHGFYDRSWKFNTNTGFDKDSDLLQIDLGEISFERQELVQDINNEEWKNAHFERSFDQETLNYFYSEMDKIDEEYLEETGVKNCSYCFSRCGG
jgi:hypothetical protein